MRDELSKKFSFFTHHSYLFTLLLENSPEVEDDSRPQKENADETYENDEDGRHCPAFYAEHKTRRTVGDSTHEQREIGNLHPPGRPNHLHIVAQEQERHEECDTQEKEYCCRQLLEELEHL